MASSPVFFRPSSSCCCCCCCDDYVVVVVVEVVVVHRRHGASSQEAQVNGDRHVVGHPDGSCMVVHGLPSSLSQDEEVGHDIHVFLLLLCPSSSCCCCYLAATCLLCLLVDHNENSHHRHHLNLNLCPTPLLHHHNRDLVPSLDLVLDLAGHALLVHHLDRRGHPSLALVASSSAAAAALLHHRRRRRHVHRDS